jgi:outer membrane protein assembly factor BamB
MFADGPYIYKIIGDKTGSNTPNVFIKPLSASGAVGNTNKIFISSGNGYTDCTCQFDDLDDAQDFLNKIIQNNRVPANVNNLRIVKNKADPNGYFLVGTEFGVVAISAKTLNEALSEAMNEPAERIPNWEKATEGYTREQLDELHTWMRRG